MSKKPRKKYRPTDAHLNALEQAMNRVRRLSNADVLNQQANARRSIEVLKAGAGLAVLAKKGDDAECLTHWKGLADVANMAETLASMGLGSGEQADAIIAAANKVLHDVFLRRQILGVWSLSVEQVDALEWLVALHCGTQLAACSYGEFERAFIRTRNRVHDAAHGNAAPGTVVVQGQIGEVANA